MNKTLRPYQQKVVDDILHELKISNEPILIDASVGAGKSLILASVLLVLERAGFHAICLTLNSTLIQQNANTYQLQGGSPSLYCASLNSKDCKNFITFATPNSVCQDIRRKGQISQKPVRLIVIDEVHNLDFHNESSMYMRIIKHYSLLGIEKQYTVKIIGLTGTPYRRKSEAIYGKEQFFKSKLCSINTSWLIEQGYLVRPLFGIPKAETFDFSQLRIENTGKFNQKQLQDIVDRNERLTGQIMRELTTIVESKYNGAFIFASTVKHCQECLKSLPQDKAAIITGETPHEERKAILEKARNGDIKYLVNVNCLTVGVDVPSFDVCCWVRPTESLILYHQGIGRVLRLHPGKEKCLILDYAGNIQRHGDIDDAIINEALKPNDDNIKDYCIPCYDCGTFNTITARRCIGIIADSKRCDHYFEFKPCPNCGVENDIVARECRGCHQELIDPNAKLIKDIIINEFPVVKANYFMANHAGNLTVHALYYTAVEINQIHESYSLKTDKSRNIFYAKFIRLHLKNASDWYMKMNSPSEMNKMLHSKELKTPYMLTCSKSEKDWKIVKKHFLPDVVKGFNN